MDKLLFEGEIETSKIPQKTANHTLV